ncbi:MAG: response regulator transcription factor [Chloroflexi bacterium]|nr:response regulator transcription factor [Chloroflexota bacterium]
MRVLIVDDDRRLAGVVRDGLEEAGIATDVVGDGLSAVRTASSHAYDVIMLDVMLGGGIDGVETCRRLRERGVSTAVLMLTALDGIPDRVRGLNAGADDYLVKPFAFAELEARLNALTRRDQRRGKVRSASGVQLDSGARRVHVNATELQLTRREFDLLEALLTNAGQVVSKDQLHRYGWGDEGGAAANLIEVYVARLRRKLADAGAADCITTLRNTGYRFEVRREAVRA